MTIERDRGSISAFVVVVTIALVGAAGLVVDGARLVAAKVTCVDHAENAARAGAQEVVVHGGAREPDPVAAVALAQRYLREHGLVGDAAVVGGRVVVTVFDHVEMAMLGLVGIGPWMFAYDARPDAWDDFTWYHRDGLPLDAPENRYADLIAELAARLG